MSPPSRPILTAVAGLALCGCADPPKAPPPESLAGIRITTAIDTSEDSPVLTVVVQAPARDTWTLELPEVPGLSWTSQDPLVELAGDRSVTTQQWLLTAAPGSYIVEGICAAPERGAPVCSETLFVDVEQPPDRTALVDIVEPEALQEPPWHLLAAGLLCMVPLWTWARRRREVGMPDEQTPTIATVTPDQAALERWQNIRTDPTLSDMDRALALSEIFRAYCEASLDFPARAWTTSQTLAWLSEREHLRKENVPRARRLLRATDHVKFAGGRPNDTFFDTLEVDFRSFIDDTRSHQWVEP